MRKQFTNAYKAPQEPVLQTNLSAEWKRTVRDKQSALQFFQQHFTHYPEALQYAMADYIDKGVRDNNLPSYMLRTEKSRWNFEQELEEEKLKGKINKQKQVIEELLLDESTEDDKTKEETKKI